MATMYERLGVTPQINGAATLTRLGGSLMPPPVVAAMVEAARHFIPMEELLSAAGRHLAQLTYNEAAYVTSGAAAGLALATAACVTGNDVAKMGLLPRPERIPGGRSKVVIHRCQRIGYDFAVRQTGVELVEIGPTRQEAAERTTSPDELAAALDERTAAVVFIAGANHARGALSLEQTVEIAHARGPVPVIVDASAQIPAVENLWYFSGPPTKVSQHGRRGGILPAPWARALAQIGVPEASAFNPEGVAPAGADLALFSGGKGLCGPQVSGLILGRADLIEAIARQANPNPFIGRPMKVGKEEICGLVAAVECYLNQDFVALAARYERQVAHVRDAVADLPGVSATRTWPSEAGQPMPRALVQLSAEAPLTAAELRRRLLAGDPPIAVSEGGTNGIYVNPQTLREGDEILVADALRRILERPTMSP